MAIRHTRQWERAVAEFLASPVDDVARKHGRAVVADVLAAAVAGSAAPGVAGVARDGAFVDGKASILGTDRRVAPPQAAMTNAAAAIAHRRSRRGTNGGHVGAGIVAGGLAARGGEQRRRRGVRRRVYSGLRYLCPAGTGDLRDERPDERRDPVARSEPALDVDDRGAGRDERPLSGRDPEELTETFRIAANLAVVSMHDPYAEGAPARNFTAGFSAQAGVTAALTALAGLEARARRSRRCTTPSRDAAGRIRQPVRDARRGVGDRGTLLQTVPVLPVHPPAARRAPRGDRRAGGRRQRAIGRQAGDRPGRRGGDHGQDVRQRDRHVSRRARDDDRREVLRTVRAGDVPLSGSVDLDHFTAEALADETVQSVAARVELREDDGYEAAFPESWGASVVVELRDGTTLTGARDYPGETTATPFPTRSIALGTVRPGARARRGREHNARVDEALDALDAVAERPVRSTVDTLRP